MNFDKNKKEFCEVYTNIGIPIFGAKHSGLGNGTNYVNFVEIAIFFLGGGYNITFLNSPMLCYY